MISVIFATKDDEAGLAWSLAALVPAATEGIVRDVTVVDDGSRDGTLVVADAAGCSILSGRDGEGQASAAATFEGKPVDVDFAAVPGSGLGGGG